MVTVVEAEASNLKAAKCSISVDSFENPIAGLGTIIETQIKHLVWVDFQAETTSEDGHDLSTCS